MVLVMVQMHGLLVNVRLQRVVRVWQRRDLMCRYCSLCHFNHLSFINTQDSKTWMTVTASAMQPDFSAKMRRTTVPEAFSAPSHAPCANPWKGWMMPNALPSGTAPRGPGAPVAARGS